MPLVSRDNHFARYAASPGVRPLWATQVAWRNAVTILVLHGGDTVFNFFMGHNPQYHELVAVSMGAISKGIAGNTRVIHAPIELGACDSTQKDFDVVYVGRITLSKDFGYFCEILEHLGDDVRVAAFGPNYANEKFTPRCTAVSMGSSNNVQRELCRAKVCFAGAGPPPLVCRVGCMMAELCGLPPPLWCGVQGGAA